MAWAQDTRNLFIILTFVTVVRNRYLVKEAWKIDLSSYYGYCEKLFLHMTCSLVQLSMFRGKILSGFPGKMLGNVRIT
jgi:hypothetical protein